MKNKMKNLIFALIVGICISQVGGWASVYGAVPCDRTTGGIKSTRALSGDFMLSFYCPTSDYTPGEYTLGTLDSAFVGYTGYNPSTEFYFYLADDSGGGTKDCRSQTVTGADLSTVTWASGLAGVASPVTLEFTGTECTFTETSSGTGSAWQIKPTYSEIYFQQAEDIAPVSYTHLTLPTNREV